MLSIDALNAYGADTPSGMARCLGNESLYLGLVEMLICDEKFDILSSAIKSRTTEACVHIAQALAETADSLALIPLAQKLEMMTLCLQLHGDSAVLDKQLLLVRRGLDDLRRIQQA